MLAMMMFRRFKDVLCNISAVKCPNMTRSSLDILFTSSQMFPTNPEKSIMSFEVTSCISPVTLPSRETWEKRECETSVRKEVGERD